MAGDDHPDLKPLTVGQCFSEHGGPVVITRWQLTDEERARVFGGEDLFLYVFAPLLPEIQIGVGSQFHEYDPER